MIVYHLMASLEPFLKIFEGLLPKAIYNVFFIANFLIELDRKLKLERDKFINENLGSSKTILHC